MCFVLKCYLLFIINVREILYNCYVTSYVMLGSAVLYLVL